MTPEEKESLLLITLGKIRAIIGDNGRAMLADLPQAVGDAIQAARQEERERCARIAETVSTYRQSADGRVKQIIYKWKDGKAIAAAIREEEGK